MIDYEFRGGEYHLYFNGYALFNFYAKYGNEKNILEVLEPLTREGYEANIWMLCELSKQGELYRRMLGEDAGQILNFGKMVIAATPADIVEIKQAVIEAINEGFRRENTEEEQDVFLSEWESENSKKKQLRRQNIFVRLRKAWDCLFMKV